MKTALLIVDIQNDFLPGGALAAPGGDEIVPLVNQLMPGYDLVVATQDWHPADHESFAVNHANREIGEVIDLHGLQQVLWPTHCVEGSPGAEFAENLDSQRIDHVFRKGMDPTVDSYSGFFDNGHRHSSGLADYLRDQGVAEVHVVGLATDYCVKFTTLDALVEGFRTTLVVDACRGVDLKPGDIEDAVEECRATGARITTTTDILGETISEVVRTIEPQTKQIP